MAALLSGSAALGSALLVPGVKRLALKGGAVDAPEARRVSTRVTPRLGGLAIFVAFALVIGLFAALGRLSLALAPPGAAAFFLASALVVGVGTLDDFRPLRPHAKLLVELGAALVVVYAGHCRIAGISVPGRHAVMLGAAAVPVTVVWIVLVTNAVNLIDGIDGLAAGTSVIALVTIAVIARGFGYPTVSAFSVALAGACVGFLIFNVHPASIFLGDAGSLFLGFAIGVLSTYARAKESAGALTIGTLLIVALPVGDTLFAIQRRYSQGLAVGSLRSHVAGLTRVFQPDRGHIHHRLLRVGLGQRGVAWALCAIQALALRVCALPAGQAMTVGAAVARPGGRRAAVVVLGDLGRSPRMQYHALALANEGFAVDLIGYGGRPADAEVQAHPGIRLHELAAPWRRRAPRALFLPVAAADVAAQAAALARLLLVALPRPDVLLTQNPPTFPTLAVARAVARARGTRWILDWHNFGADMLALRLGAAHPAVGAARALERALGRGADGHLCVSAAMRDALAARWGIADARVLRDRPAKRVGRTPPDQRARLFERYGVAVAPGAPDRPAVIVTASSWTADEDFALLLDAMDACEAARARAPGALPRLLFLMTGDGPERAAWERRFAARAFRHVRAQTVWADAADYPRLLGAAELGVSLHRSASGVDLPMKNRRHVRRRAPGVRPRVRARAVRAGARRRERPSVLDGRRARAANRRRPGGLSRTGPAARGAARGRGPAGGRELGRRLAARGAPAAHGRGGGGPGAGGGDAGASAATVTALPASTASAGTAARPSAVAGAPPAAATSS